MSGFQFVHVQAFSRKAITGKAGSDGVVRGGRASVRGVLAEAAREDGACLHVEAPCPPLVVYGMDPAGVERLHDERCEAGRSEVEGSKARKIRVDQATLLTVVASYPATVSECAADPAKARDRDAWQARNVAWLESEFGSRLVGVLRHDDEAYPHLHAFILPDDLSMKANPLHPGWAAKQSARTVAESAGMDSKAANVAGDRAYREAMRGLQDRYWEAVGLPSGLARVGPARRRLTRDAWKAEQAQVAAAATMIGAVELARAEAAKVTAAATTTKSEAEARAAELSARGKDFVSAARAAAAAAKADADAATAAAARAREAESAARSAAAVVIQDARREASAMVRAAEERVVRARRIGGVLGAVWVGLAGVGRRIKARAEDRMRTVRTEAKAAVASARKDAVAAVGGELLQLRGQVAEATHRVHAAELHARKAEAAAAAERAARQKAESERESFRSRWAVADNALQARRSGLTR